MIARAYVRSLSNVRWSRDRIQHHLRRLLKPRLSGLVFYILVIIFILCSFSSLPSLAPHSSAQNGKSKESDITKNEPSKKDGDPSRVKRTPPLVNPHNYHLMISNSALCADEDEVQLLILVTSSASHLDQRQAIRSTWGKPDYLVAFGAKLIFLLANPNNSKIQRKIVEEYRSYGDLIQEDFVESYMNLTLKTIMGIKWASSYCAKASFVMKTDDDMFINIPLLASHLKTLDAGMFFTGCIKQRNSFKPVNANPNSILPPAHPLFAAGAGYIFSGPLLPRLYEASTHKRIIPVEDVYITGHLAKMVNAHPPIHDDRFSCGEIIRDDCHMLKVFTGHKVSPEKMFELWKIFDPSRSQNLCP